MVKYMIWLMFFLSCGSKKKQQTTSNERIKEYAYAFDTPDEVFILSSELSEISGLDYIDESNSFVAVNDEKGTLYNLNATNGQIISSKKFAKHGDYEGIENTPFGTFVVSNDGNLFLVGKKKDSKKIKTVLNKSNDVEGLCYHADRNGLLLACKGQAKIRTQTTRLNPTRAIYLFDLDSKRLELEPYVEIVNKELLSWCSTRYSLNYQDVLEKNEMNKRIRDFAPSGIAMHPTTKEYFILSSRGKMIVVLKASKEIGNVYFLNPSMHAQPEGITFDSIGNLYISNEGKELTSKLIKYSK